MTSLLNFASFKSQESKVRVLSNLFPAISLKEKSTHFQKFFQERKQYKLPDNFIESFFTRTQIKVEDWPKDREIELIQKKLYQKNFESKRIKKARWKGSEKRLLSWVVVHYCFEHFIEPEAMNELNWFDISKNIYGRSANECYTKWYENPTQTIYDCPWSLEEDQLLAELGSTQTEKNWVLIAQKINELEKSVIRRTSKQCRERWVHKVDPDLNKLPWNDLQDLQLLYVLLQLGKKWSEVQKQFQPKRTEFQLRQRMQYLLRKSKPFTVIWSKERKFLEKLANQLRQNDDCVSERWNDEELMLLLESIKTLEEKLQLPKPELKPFKVNRNIIQMIDPSIFEEENQLTLVSIDYKEQKIYPITKDNLHFMKDFRMPLKEEHNLKLEEVEEQYKQMNSQI